MKRRAIIRSTMASLIAALFTGCATAHVEPGPGMIATFTNIIEGKDVDVKDARTSSGRRFPYPGAVSYSARGWGKTMGASPDGRELPEWVEFEWKESDSQYRGTMDEHRALPRKTERVAVRSRVPQDVVQEVIEANRQTLSGNLPSKSLWIYFEWAKDGIRFQWRLKERLPAGGSRVLRKGGDEVRAM